MRTPGLYAVFFITLLLFLQSGGAVFAQYYENIHRPSRPAWQQLETPHFRILFQEGEETAAWRSAHLLEEQYPHVQSLVGGSLSDFPVILNSQNDRSNGYVSTLNFRMEVEIPRMKAKTMNPADGNWLNTVIPHELVHALHLNAIPSFGVSGVTQLLSPDIARSMHLAAPLGMLEGIAVFHESHHHYGIGGRGNHSYFTQRHNAVFDSDKRWSLSQMLMDPAHSYPFNRHYIGGHHFINWLQYEYGMDITKQTIRFVSRWPFLGYGSALWYHTGERPSKLYSRFKQVQEEEAAETRVGDATKSDYDAPPQIETLQNRGPLWISDEILLYYGSSYDQRPGFFKYDTQSGTVSRIAETGTVADYSFSLHPDRSRMLYARYHQHPFYHNYERMKIHEITLDSGDIDAATGERDTADRISRGVDRIYAPEYGPGDTIWGLQTHHEKNILVQLTESGPDTLLVPESGHLVEIGFHPESRDSLYILANRDGLQGLWFLQKNRLDEYNKRNPDIAFEEASIYDPHWHPDGDRLIFTSDFSGTFNLFELHLRKEALFQLTDHRYGVMESSYSPDGRRLAGVQIIENKHELFLKDRDDLVPVRIPQDNWKNPPYAGSSPPPGREIGPDSSESQQLSNEWPVSPYYTGLSWMKPRSLLPWWENESQLIGNRFGVLVSSGDVLRRNSYMAELSTSNNRFWYDVEYRYSGFYPGFQLNGYQRPVHTTAGLLESRGGGVEIPLRYTTEQDIRRSAFTIIPGVDFQQQRAIATDGSTLSSWIQRTSTSLFLSYEHRLQQNIRDVQPNTGWVIFQETEWDLTTDYTEGKLRALRAGIYRYLSPRLSSNQSLRLGTEWMTQTHPFFDINGFFSRGFDDQILEGVNNAARLNIRYTLPLWHRDQGWILIPAFIDRIYAVLFSDTIGPLKSRNIEGLYHNSRSLFGAGLRLQMRLFNFPVDIGAAVAYEPTRENTEYILGSF